MRRYHPANVVTSLLFFVESRDFAHLERDLDSARRELADMAEKEEEGALP